MNNEVKKSTSRVRSFSYATNGLFQLFRQETNAKLHSLATILVIVAGIIRKLGPNQWIAIIIAIGIVWMTEAINTCIEKLCDFACDNKWHPEVKIIKDIAAGAVLIAAMVSVAIAIIVFLF